MARVSFDYDGVLSTKDGKIKAIAQMKLGNEVWIITRRQMENSEAVYSTAKELGIKREHVVFTNGKAKWQFMERFNIDVHFDNNPNVVKEINEKTKTKSILFT